MSGLYAAVKATTDYSLERSSLISTDKALLGSHHLMV